ncbi:MAG: T9SS C-terminal target domain-containing protein [Calditrichaeota bacterium]|nr:MAG: T9SS C-terminal target domain-containing protein [Calditrichota bacterium]
MTLGENSIHFKHYLRTNKMKYFNSTLKLSLLTLLLAFSPKQSQAQTVTTNLGLYGCTGQNVVVDENGIVYLGVNGPQPIYISSNNGTSWSGGLPTDSLETQGGNNTGLDVFADSVYFSTDNGVFRTDDAGSTWSPILLPSSGKSNYQQIAINSNHDIFIGNRSGEIYYSDDLGVSFTTQSVTGTVGDAAQNIRFDPSNTTNIFSVFEDASNNGFLYKSTDTGSSWAKLTVTDTSSATEITNIHKFGVHPSSADTIYVGTLDNKVYKTTDAGVNWKNLPSYQVNYGLPNFFFEDDTVYVAGYRSLDHGVTFQKLNGDIDSKGIALDPNNDSFYYAFGALGINVSTDGGASYNISNTGIEAVQISKMSQLPAQKDTVWVATESGLARGINFTTTPIWTFPVDVGFDVSGHNAVEIDSSNTSNVYSANVRIHQTTNFGTNWNIVYDEGLSLVEQYQFSEILAIPDTISTITSQIVVATARKTDSSVNGYIIRSVDGGANWTKVFTGTPVNTVVRNPHNGKLYAGVGDSDQDTVQGGIYVSSDDGATWTQMTTSSGVDITTYVVNHIEFHPTFSNLMFVSCGANNSSGAILRSMNYGTTFTDLSPTPAPQSKVVSSVIDLDKPYLIYSCSGNQVFKRNHFLGGWSLSYTGLPGEQINFLFYDGLVMGTSTGFYGIEIPDTTVISSVASSSANSSAYDISAGGSTNIEDGSGNIIATVTNSGANATSVQIALNIEDPIVDGGLPDEGWNYGLRWWNINVVNHTSGINDPVIVTFYIDETELNGIDPNDLRVYHYDSGDSEYDLLSDYIVDLSNLPKIAITVVADEFSPFIPGAGNTDEPLSVELKSFYAKQIERKVKLYWRTETETNNVGFKIYRSNNNSDFSMIADYRNFEELTGQLNSTTENSYSFVDSKVEIGNEYSYKISDINLDAKETIHSQVIKLYLDEDLENPIENLRYELKQNFPNPFNPSTTIGFSIKNEGFTKLSIFNILGQRVKNILATKLEKGNYEIGWNGTDERGNLVSNGIYYYKLESGTYYSIRKMILLK